MADTRTSSISGTNTALGFMGDLPDPSAGEAEGSEPRPELLEGNPADTLLSNISDLGRSVLGDSRQRLK